MKVMVETIDMLRRGITLGARRSVARRGRPLKIAPYTNTIQRCVINGRYVYEITDRRMDPEGVVQSFFDVEHAARTFAEQVGWVALNSEVSSKRYNWMFPLGSTLDWHTQEHQSRAA